ncbi:hypothetical protein B0H14DRAFT_2731566, partial [Mycena olivaceomarginata]
MPTSCTFSVSSPLLPPLGDRQGTASCLPPFARAVPRPAATDDTPPPTSTPFFSNEMILTHLLASRNTVHARVAEVVRAVAGNKTPCAEPRVIRLRKRCCAARRRGHERAAGVFVERDGVPGGVCMRRVRTLVSTSASANTSACVPAPSMSGLMCALLGHDHARTWTKRGPCSIDSKEWITVSTPRITRLLVIITRCRFVYCLRTVVLIFCKEKAEYAPYYRHSLIFRWIVLGADCLALRNAHAPRVCEGIGRCVGPLRAS